MGAMERMYEREKNQKPDKNNDLIFKKLRSVKRTITLKNEYTKADMILDISTLLENTDERKRINLGGLFGANNKSVETLIELILKFSNKYKKGDENT